MKLAMKRQAILLGHIDGHLATTLDLVKVHDFLTTCRGGAWDDSEIISETNIPRQKLDRLLSKTRECCFDFVFFYFSGHGGYARDTVIELNPHGETVREAELSRLAPRQIIIFDCCRVQVTQEITKRADLSNRAQLMEAWIEQRLWARKMYENRILQACPQQLSLYACQIGECAFDFGAGGIYTHYLLEAAKQSENAFVLASSAHDISFTSTLVEARNHGEVQHPDYFMAKLPSRLQLILAINASLFSSQAIR